MKELRPFVSFYGGKWRLAPKYPRPMYNTIIEPFAGSAGYSLRYPEWKVILCEKDPLIASIWKYLIRVKPSEILSLPDLREGENVDDLHVCQEAKWLIGFWLQGGVSSPRNTHSTWSKGKKGGIYWGARLRERIATQIGYIRHWQITNCDYSEIEHIGNATWFIDPPYQNKGKHYRLGSKLIDFSALAEWCKSRNGQVMVCENIGATWLPFEHFATMKGASKQVSKEVIWTNKEQL